MYLACTFQEDNPGFMHNALIPAVQCHYRGSQWQVYTDFVAFRLCLLVKIG